MSRSTELTRRSMTASRQHTSSASLAIRQRCLPAWRVRLASPACTACTASATEPGLTASNPKTLARRPLSQFPGRSLKRQDHKELPAEHTAHQRPARPLSTRLTSTTIWLRAAAGAIAGGPPLNKRGNQAASPRHRLAPTTQHTKGRSPCPAPLVSRTMEGRCRAKCGQV
jgi:hypothetical protein